MRESRSTTPPQETTQAAIERAERFSGAGKAISQVERLISKKQIPCKRIDEVAEIDSLAPSAYFFKDVDPNNLELQLESERMLSGIVDSAHAVTIVEMNDGNATKLLAAKHFAKRPLAERLDRVKMEIAVMKELGEKGLPAFTPVALTVSPPQGESEGEIVLFTEFDKGIFTMDNYPWGRGCTEKNVEVAKKAAQAVGDFNALGYRHKDAKIKNVAQQEVDGSVGLIDFETTEIVDHSDPMEASITVNEDLTTMLDSLEKRSLFKQATVSEVEEVVQELVDVYSESWSTHLPEVQDAVLETIVDVATTFVDQVQQKKKTLVTV